MRVVATSLGLLLGTVVLNGALHASSETPQRDSRSDESRSAQSTARTSIDSDLGENHAADWGLRSDEWTRFRQLMRGPLGILSPNLDPVSALGIEARSAEERRHYAELQVRVEGHRVEKLLAYQRAYDDAWKRLSPDLSPLKPEGFSASNPARVAAASAGAGRLAVFVKADCALCDERVKALQASGRAFDVYMVGSLHEDARIRQWAAHAGIDPAKVRSRTITLNHDAGRWLSLSLQGELPAVVQEANGQWHRE